MEQQNILFLSSWYPNKKAPTLGNFIQRHAQAVASKHNVIVLFATSLPELSEEFKLEETLCDNVTEVRVYYKKPITKIEKLLWVFKALQIGLNHIEKKYKINFVHLNVIRPLGLFALYLKKFKGLNYIITEHWTGFLPENNYYKQLSFLEKKLTEQVVKNAQLVCPVTQNLANNMTKLGLNGNYKPVPNVVDFKIFFPERETENYFLHVSHVKQSHKNILGILEAFAIFLKTQNAQLIIIADEDTAHVSQKIEDLNLQDNVLILNNLPNQEVAQYMKKALAVVLFSNYENLPCVLTESAACGTRIITTPVGGITEYFKHDGRFVFITPPQNTAMLAENFSACFSQTISFAEKEKFSEFAKEHFSVEAVANAYQKVYQSLTMYYV